MSRIDSSECRTALALHTKVPIDTIVQWPAPSNT
jgi:hypothetical protein